MVQEDSDAEWPPGTARIELLKEGGGHDIILQPQPTTSPNDPLNWPAWRKHLNFGLANFYTLMMFVCIDASTPTWGPMAEELNFSEATLTDTFAIWSATLAIGAAMLIPFALKYGLRPIYVFSSIGQFAVMIWAARLMTAGDLWGINSVSNWLGSLAEAMVQMTIADVYFVHQRGLANSIYILLANTGATLGPVVSGFVTVGLGWRWVWWMLAIFFGVQFVVMFFGFEESQFNVAESFSGKPAAVDSDKDEQIIVAKEKSSIDNTSGPQPLDNEKNDIHVTSHQYTLHGAPPIEPNIKRKTYKQQLRILSPSPGKPSEFLRHSWQPFAILFTIPGVAYASMVYAVLMAWNTVQGATISIYMLEPPYNFSSQAIGLMYLAPCIGNAVGSFICGPISDWLILVLAKRNKGVYEPEMRFWIFLPFVPFQVACAWWFGYAIARGDPWISAAMAWGIQTVGQAPISAMALTYLTDSYNEIIGDVLVSLTFTRNTLATIFVFALAPWVKAVGIANVYNTINSIGLVVLLFSGVLIWKGKHWRHIARQRYHYFAKRQFNPRSIKN